MQFQLPVIVALFWRFKCHKSLTAKRNRAIYRYSDKGCKRCKENNPVYFSLDY